MRKLSIIFILLISFTSCVSIFNRDHTVIHIHADKRAEVIYNKQYADVNYSAHYLPEDSIDSMVPICYGDVPVLAKRSKTEVLNVVIFQDGIEKKIAIKPVHSWLYYANIYPGYGLGFFVDCHNPNRFTYPHHIYLDVNDNSGKGYSIHKPFKTSRIDWVFNPPFINGYILGFNYLMPAYSPFGLSTGINYHYNKEHFLSGEIGVAAINTGYHRYHSRSDSLFFLYHSGWPKEHRAAYYLNLMNNHVQGRFDFGYGLAIGRHTGSRAYARYKMADTVLYSADYLSLGCSVSAHYRLSNACFAGINYQPQVMAIDNISGVIYEHLINFGFSWRIPMSKNRLYIYR